MKNIICIRCPRGCRISINIIGKELQVDGSICEKGVEYAKEEYFNPCRILPTTVKIVGGELPLVPVKTRLPIPRDCLLSAMQEIAQLELNAPVYIGQIIIENLSNTGVELIATRTVKKVS